MIITEYSGLDEISAKGYVTYITRNENREIIDVKSAPNNIVLGVRAPIIKLLGSYQNAKMQYNLNNAGWAYVPDSGALANVNGNLNLRIDMGTMPYVASIAFGDDASPATIYQTGLLHAIAGAEKILSAAPIFSAEYLQGTFAVLFGLNELNDTTIREAALKCADGTVIARAPIGEYTKLPGTYFEFYWTIGYAA